MLYREIMAVCSEIHTKHINTLCGQNVELLNVKLVVHHATRRLKNVDVQSVHFVGSYYTGIRKGSHCRRPYFYAPCLHRPEPNFVFMLALRPIYLH